MTLFTKIAEGGSYRIFEASLRNGLKVIARLPYPCTIPQKYGIASEVATMDFLQLHGVPIPKVFDWDSSSANAVGSEYIVMEKVPGKELEESWCTMTIKERMAMMEKVVKVERTLFSLQFPASGSLFYKESLGTEAKTVDIPSTLVDTTKFCIGPSTEYLWWFKNRHELSINHGPWENPEDVLKTVGKRELLWLQKYGEPRWAHEPLYREFYGRQKVDPQVQIGNLRDYLKIAPYIVPNSQELKVPILRHPDLSPSNIFVSESGDIIGIIDWQHSVVLPIFLQAKMPKHFQNYDADEKDREMELYRRRQVHFFYIGFTDRLSKPHFRAMGKHNLVLRNRLYDTACRPWEGDNTSLQAEMICTLEHWDEIAAQEGKPNEPSVLYTPEETKECLERYAKQKEADEQMQRMRDFIGVNVEGWAPDDTFDEAKERAEHIKNELLGEAETEDDRKELLELWQFQDHEEID